LISGRIKEVNVAFEESMKLALKLGVSKEELTFYDTHVADPEVLRNMEDYILVQRAQKLTVIIRKSWTVDWEKTINTSLYEKTNKSSPS